MRNSGHSEKTEKHWKHRKAHRKHPKCHQKHRKHIGKASERHLKGSCDPSKCICFDVPRRPGHRKGIGKASENIWKYWKAWGNIGKHRKTSDPTWKNLNKDGNSRSLSDSLICSTKQPHWRHLEIAVFCILIPCLFAQQSRLIGCSWQTSPPKENCTSYEAVNDFTQVAWIPKLNREQISCKIVFIWRPFFNWKHKARMYIYI